MGVGSFETICLGGRDKFVVGTRTKEETYTASSKNFLTFLIVIRAVELGEIIIIGCCGFFLLFKPGDLSEDDDED